VHFVRQNSGPYLARRALVQPSLPRRSRGWKEPACSTSFLWLGGGRGLADCRDTHANSGIGRVRFSVLMPQPFRLGSFTKARIRAVEGALQTFDFFLCRSPSTGAIRGNLH